MPALSPTENAVAQANVAAAHSAGPASAGPGETSANNFKPASEPTPAPAPTRTPAPAKPTSAPIIPDDVRPAVRAEDFLPYFQIPGAAAPAPLPPSTATYTQSK